MFHITQVNMTLTEAEETAAPCGGARRTRPRCMRGHERVKWEWVLGEVGRTLLPTGLDRADSLRGGEAVGDNTQPMGGLAMQGHFKSAQICRGCIAAVAVDHLKMQMSASRPTADNC